jgi:anthranilate synthase/aminodeoxychorismate synthase-like glutamine amidotransferase
VAALLAPACFSAAAADGRAMLLIIDNYDSFTYNLVQYFGEMGAQMEIRRNDQVTLDEIRQLRPDHICVSPGPCTPKEAGISCDVIRTFGPSIPLLGVCLGHQSIGHVFGGEVVRAGRLMHGKTSRIHHNGTSVFKGLPDPFEATRYHSLLVKRDTLPDCLEITAVAVDDESEIMGLRHKEFPIHGVQFHPESILTQQGKQLLQNFLDL